VDNSNNEDFHKELITKYGFDIDYLNPNGMRNVDYMCASQNRCRSVFLESDCEYMLFLECDVFPPLGIIEHLVSLNKLVVAIPYFTNSGENSQLITTEIEKHFGEVTRHVYNVEEFISIKGTLQKRGMVGWGCTLIHRSVIEQHKFYVSYKQKNVHADTFFYLDMFDAGIEVFQDTWFNAEHDNISWNTISDVK
jgi:hypothetical protein